MMADAEGRWFRFSVGMDSLLLIEKKGLPQHLQGLPFADAPVALEDIVRQLQDSGEAWVGRLIVVEVLGPIYFIKLVICQVKIEVSHHSFNDGMDTCAADKQLVFVMDAPAEEKGKKKNKGVVNHNAFGNALDISKFKGNTKFITSFRCRCCV